MTAKKVALANMICIVDASSAAGSAFARIVGIENNPKKETVPPFDWTIAIPASGKATKSA